MGEAGAPVGTSRSAGRLESDAKGFPVSAMAKKNAGDGRDPAHVHRWVGAPSSRSSTGSPPGPRPPTPGSRLFPVGAVCQVRPV